MKIKGPITVKAKGYIITIKDLDIAPSDPSVGIMGETLEGFVITKISVPSTVKERYGRRKMSPATKKHLLDKFYNSGPEDDDSWLLELEKAVFNELYEKEKKGYKKAYQRARKRGYKGTYKEWISEYT